MDNNNTVYILKALEAIADNKVKPAIAKLIKQAEFSAWKQEAQEKALYEDFKL